MIARRPFHFPFPVSVYGQTFNSANVASNGSLDLIGTQAPFTHGCQVLPSNLWTMAIFPYQDDLRTDQFSGCAGFPGGTCGVFTSVTGTAPNRHFNVEWRAVHFADTTTSVNFEVVFSENQTSFDVIYGATSDNGLDETTGVQASETGPATTFSCGTATLTNGLKVTYNCAGGGGSPTPTATAWLHPVARLAGPQGHPRLLPAVRSAGVYFPANGKFYAMGGRSADTAGSDFTHPFEYDPVANTWTTKAATYADNQVNNMACGVLTDAGTPYIYCVGGSAAGATVATGRVFRYNPVTDTISAIAAPWPQGTVNVLPGGFTIFQNKLYILGGFDIPGGIAK